MNLLESGNYAVNDYDENYHYGEYVDSEDINMPVNLLEEEYPTYETTSDLDDLSEETEIMQGSLLESIEDIDDMEDDTEELFESIDGVEEDDEDLEDLLEEVMTTGGEGAYESTDVDGEEEKEEVVPMSAPSNEKGSSVTEIEREIIATIAETLDLI